MLKCIEERAEVGLVLAPDADGLGVNRLAHLHEAGRTHDASVRMEVEAGWVPIETQEFDQPARLTFGVGHEQLILKVEPLERPGFGPVRDEALVIGEKPREGLGVAVPGYLRKACSPARHRDVA